RLCAQFGREPLMVGGLAAAALGTGVLGFMTDPWLFFLASLIAGAGTGMLNAPQQAAIADLVGQEGKAGTVMSSAQMASDIGSIAGPLFIGWLVDVYGFSWGVGITGLVLPAAGIVWLFAPETNARLNPEGPGTGQLRQASPAMCDSETHSDET